MSIKTTTNYDKFTLNDANRTILEGHVNNLRLSIRKHPELLQSNPIIVNEEFEVIDGQHRLEACRLEEVPVSYMVCAGASVLDALQLNINRRNWRLVDYANFYKNSNQNYKTFVDTYKNYTLSCKVVIRALTGTISGGHFIARFKNGEFEVDDLERATTELGQITDIEEILGYTGNEGLYGALFTIFRSKYYDHKRMLKKLQLYAGSMTRKVHVKDNLRDLEEIYSYNNHSDNKVRLF